MNGTAKARRQQAILELVRSRAIASQEELARDLGRRGHTVAQSTLSRDLKELRIFRVPGAAPAGAEAEVSVAGTFPYQSSSALCVSSDTDAED